MKKILLMLISFVLLGACAQSAAMLGPAITMGTTGNVLQAGFSYGGNVVVKETTGKTPGEHVTIYVSNQKEEKKLKKKHAEITNYLVNHIKVMKKKLSEYE